MSVFQTHVNYASSTYSYPSSESDGRISPTASSPDSSAPSTPQCRAQGCAGRSADKKASNGKSGQSGRGDPWKRLRYYSRSSASPAAANGGMSRADSSSSMGSVPAPSFLSEAAVPLPSFMMPKSVNDAPRACSCQDKDIAHLSPLVQWAHSSRASV